MRNKIKIIIFERLNLFNFTLALIYTIFGFDVMYFTANERIEKIKWLNFFRKQFSISQISQNLFDFNTRLIVNARALNDIDLIYESMAAKNKSMKIIKSIFKSDIIETVYKKIVLEKLLFFYSTQAVMNMIVKNVVSNEVYYIPSQSLDFVNLTRRFHSLSLMDKKIKIPRYLFVIYPLEGLFNKIAQISLLAVWPLVLVRDIKKIIPSTPPKKEYITGIRVYENGYNFKSQYRKIDFLLDGKSITKDNTLFCIETEIDKDFRNELNRGGYNFVDMFGILREINQDFIKKVFFKILFPAWAKLCLVSILEPPFIIHSYRSILGLYLRWKAFLEKYNLKNYVVYNDFTMTHIIRNILLSQNHIKTWYYSHSCHTEDLFVSLHDIGKIKSVDFSYLYYDNFITWGKRLSDFFMGHRNNVGNFITVGCLWSEHIKEIAETNDYSETLSQIYAKYRQNGSGSRKIIGIFDTTFGKTAPLNMEDRNCFFEGILKLQKERKDYIFIIKLKNYLKDVEKWSQEVLHYYKEMNKLENVYLFEDLHDPSFVNAICDLGISACFTSTANEALGFGKKAIYFDGASRFGKCYYDSFPNLVAHGYNELIRLVDHWLYNVNDKEFCEYIDKHIKHGIDPYADGMAITRFRELLVKQ